MWYDVNAKIELSSAPKYIPHGCEILTEGTKTFALIKWSDEGFNSSDYAFVLKLARKKGKFNVRMSDHKGNTSFKVAYGPNFYEEE